MGERAFVSHSYWGLFVQLPLCSLAPLQGEKADLNVRGKKWMRGGCHTVISAAAETLSSGENMELLKLFL